MAFWVVSVVLGGLDDSGRTGLPIYVRPVPVVDWFAYIYAMAVCAIPWGLKLFSTFFIYFDLALAMPFYLPTLVDVAHVPSQSNPAPTQSAPRI